MELNTIASFFLKGSWTTHSPLFQVSLYPCQFYLFFSSLLQSCSFASKSNFLAWFKCTQSNCVDTFLVSTAGSDVCRILNMYNLSRQGLRILYGGWRRRSRIVKVIKWWGCWLFGTDHCTETSQSLPPWYQTISVNLPKRLFPYGFRSPDQINQIQTNASRVKDRKREQRQWLVEQGNKLATGL